jgi:hypothetical protein
VAQPSTKSITASGKLSRGIRLSYRRLHRDSLAPDYNETR